VEEQLGVCLDFLEGRNLLVDPETPATDDRGNVLGKEAFCICTKTDSAKPGAVEKLKQLCRYPFEFVEISTESGGGLDELPGVFFRLLKIIRVYAKPPGKKPDMNEPFTLPAGSTVMDLAGAVHRQLAENLRFARIWGTGVYDGQNAPRNHVLHDRDIIELHFS
jgi:ribosome-interacting GTPase 1